MLDAGSSDLHLEAPTQAPKTGISAQFLNTFIRLQSTLDQHHELSAFLTLFVLAKTRFFLHIVYHSVGEPVVVDGHTLNIADVVAAARYGAPVQLSSANDVRKRVERSQQTIEAKLAAGSSVYGLSTGAHCAQKYVF